MALPKTIDTENTVLFLGSGFTVGARAVNGISPPAGNGLRDVLAKALSVPADKYTLPVLADAFKKRPELDLYQILRNTFTISQITNEQKIILNRKWLRIYTTNYDDAVELGYRHNRIEVPSYNYDDPKPAKVSTGSIIHLHGVIRKANEDNVLDQLILGRKSYIDSHFAKSPWYDDFVRDIRFCDNIYFVGYSLQDPHITAIVPKTKEIKEKTFFILKGPRDDFESEQLEEFGEIHLIETKGFADVCQNTPRPTIETDYKKLKSIKYINPFKDKKSVVDPTSIEVSNLITFGRFEPARCLTNLPKSQYVVPRKAAAIAALELLERSSTLLVHSHLGNGKSIFLYILAHELISRGNNCFKCETTSSILDRDIKSLAGLEKVVIFFDEYDVAVSVIDRFADHISSVKFIVAVRSGLQDVRSHEVTKLLRKPINRIGLNTLSSEDKIDFINLLLDSGMVRENFRNRILNSNETRDIVTIIYESKYVKDRIRSALDPIMRDKKTLSVLAITFIMSHIGFQADLSLFYDILELDARTVLSENEEVIGDIVLIGEDRISARSSLMADYLIKNQFDVDDLLIIIKLIIVKSVERKKERKYRAILSALMSFSGLHRLLGSFKNSGDKIRSLYSELQRDVDIREEPLFWLQYTIAMIDGRRLDLAEGYMETAYDKANSTPLFETYQLDTQALRLYLLIEANKKLANNLRLWDKILEKTEIILLMLSDHNHRDFAIKVLADYEPFILKRYNGMGIGEKEIVLSLVKRVIIALGSLSEQARAETGADLIKLRVEKALASVLSE